VNIVEMQMYCGGLMDKRVKIATQYTYMGFSNMCKIAHDNG